MAASSSNAGCSRVKNTASVKDLKKCFRLHMKEDHLDVRSFREDEDVVIKKYEQLLLDILDQTLRPTEGVLRSATLDASRAKISNKDATACARALHGCFKHCRSKLQSTTSGKRLDPATFRIVQRIKELQGPKASPASNTSSPRGSASSLAISPSPAKPKKLLFVESPTLRVKGKQSGSSAEYLLCMDCQSRRRIRPIAQELGPDVLELQYQWMTKRISRLIQQRAKGARS